MNDVVWEPYVAGVPRPSSADLDELERVHGICLPDDYRQVVMCHAGDAPREGVIKVGRGSTPFGPLLFVSHGRDHPAYASYSIDFALEVLAEWAWNSGPVRYFPFASNTSTGLFCFDVGAGSADPTVVFVDYSYDPDQPGGVLAVAASFGATLAQLTTD